MFKDKKIIMAVLAAVLVPILFSSSNGAASTLLDKALLAIPTEIILTIIATFIAYKIGIKYTGIRKARYKKFYYFIPQSILIIYLLISLKVPSVSYSPAILIKLLILSLLVGIYEELLSRGIALHLFARSGSDKVAIFASGIMFGVLHFMNYNGFNGADTFLTVVETFAVGIYSSVMVLTLRSIIPLMITHFLYDYILFVDLYFKSLMGISDTYVPNIFNLGSYILPLLYLLVAFLVYKREKENIYEYVEELTLNLSSQKEEYTRKSPMITIVIVSTIIVSISLIQVYFL